MKIISINAGSSSLKFSLIDMENEEIIASGVFERIGKTAGNGSFTIKFNGQKYIDYAPLEDHNEAVNILLDKLISLKIVTSLEEIEGVGNRVVQGKDIFDGSVIVDDDVWEKLEQIKNFAPLHNPANMLGIRAFQKALPNAVHTAVFDTAFHQTMQPTQFMYPVPYEWYEKYGIRKYGAHGTSHRYISETVKKILGKDQYKLISCHIGNGGSISAIKDGKCVDTSMGFTPLAGIMMGTRCGDIDSSILTPVMEKENLTIEDAINKLNKESGLLGVSGISSDMRDIEKAYNDGNEKAILALNMYVQKIVNYIANYYVLLGGADVIVFTAGVGENCPLLRKMVCDKLACLNVSLDSQKNNVRGTLAQINDESSKVKVYVIPTDEEIMIARDTLELIKNNL